MALEAADAVAPALALGGVLVGLLVTGRRQDAQWRRDRRTEAYAAVLTAGGDLAQQLSRLRARDAHGDEDPRESVPELTHPLSAACDLAVLYAGSMVTLRLQAVQREVAAFARQVPADLSLHGFSRAMSDLQWDMRLELRPGSPSLVRALAGVRAFREEQRRRKQLRSLR